MLVDAQNSVQDIPRHSFLFEQGPEHRREYQKLTTYTE